MSAHLETFRSFDIYDSGVGCWQLFHTLSEQIAHSTVDLHLKEINEFLRGSMMNKNFILP